MPELRNSEMMEFYFDSPHTQIFTDFNATVVKVHDGDTITVETDFRDFSFPIRFLNTNAPELNEDGGHASRDWLESWILGEEVTILVDPKNRVEKWGRLLGQVMFEGVNMNRLSVATGHATTFELRNAGKIPSLDKLFELKL